MIPMRTFTVTEQRGRRLIAPGFVALACAAAVARVIFGGSRNTATLVAAALLGVVGLASLAFCGWLARAGRAQIVASAEEIRWVGSGRAAERIDRSHGDEVIVHITPTTFSRRGGQQYTWELVTPDGAQRIGLMHFDQRMVADACRRAGWAVTEGQLGRIPGR